MATVRYSLLCSLRWLRISLLRLDAHTFDEKSLLTDMPDNSGEPKKHLGSHPTTSRRRRALGKTEEGLVSTNQASLPSCNRAPIPSRITLVLLQRLQLPGASFA